MKQELEEAAEKFSKSYAGDEIAPVYEGFIEGTKYQAERMYSEEDLISFAHFYFKEEFNSSMQTSKSTKDIFTEWFEQNKKK